MNKSSKPEIYVFVFIMEDILKDLTSFEIYQKTLDIYMNKFPYDNSDIIEEFTQRAAEKLPEFAILIWSYYFDKREFSPKICKQFL